MQASRRKFLSLVGGGAVLAVALPATAFLTTRTPTKALAPWDMAGQYPDPRLRALSFALLAPNPHNRQPWEAELIGADEVLIWRDPTRDLPATDPHARQLTIGMGCFLELMDVAAAQEGFAVDTAL
ncbi:MAG: twin-arginine translocation pathway signal protein, partial [Pseudomonadota bacterium]